jgi:hypothetical protein
MRFCPKCRGEFQDWVKVCLDCGVTLVDHLPEEPKSKIISRGTELNSRKYSNEKIVTIATFNHPEEAQLSHAKLESEGIPSFVADSNFVSANRFYSILVGGVRLQVKESDVEAALRILDIERGKVSNCVNNDTQITDEKCPNCSSSDIQYETFSLRRVFISILLLGFPLLFFKRHWKCRKCDYEWNEASLK